MTEENQKKLYENFKKEAEENNSPIVKEKCRIAAADILKSFPDFEKTEPVKPETAAEKKAREKAAKEE